jgi:hypothetical protein
VKRSWEIIADELSKAGSNWGCVSAVTGEGRIIWVADAHRDDGKRPIKVTRMRRFVSPGFTNMERAFRKIMRKRKNFTKKRPIKVTRLRFST